MYSLNLNHFDVLEYVKQARRLGASEELAEFQARQISQVTESQNKQLEEMSIVIKEQSHLILEQGTKLTALELKEPATKKDLEITKLELQKEIEVVHKEIEVVHKEIEVVRKEIEVMRKELESKIESSKIWTLLVLVGGWASMLAIVAKGFHWW